MPAFDQYLDHGHHLRNIGGCARRFRWIENAKFGHVIKIPLDGLIGDLANRSPCLRCTRVDLVVYIGEVSHVFNVVLSVNEPQEPKERIKNNGRPRIADMRTVIDRGSAHIHAHVARIERLEPFFGSSLGVVQQDLGHGFLTRAV